MSDPHYIEEQDANPPIFNLPKVIVLLLVILVSMHATRVWFVPEAHSQDFILLFAAIPARYSEWGGQIPYSFAAWYTPLSHALVHADWGHLAMNSLWMLAFGSPVAKRFGAMRFIALAAVGALAGFGFHLATHLGEIVPMVGASGAVSAFMGAAIRLNGDVFAPVLPLIRSFQNRTIVAFVGVWFVFNFLVGAFPEFIGMGDTQIAWQAHIGGFLAGFLGFSFFDKAR